MLPVSHANAQPFSLGSGRDICLLIHGFTATPAQLRPLGERLAAAGYRAEGILLPGHGSTIQDMEKSGWKQWLNAAVEAATRLREEGDRLCVLGVSMGGILSLLLGERGLADAVVSMAAPMRIYGGGSARFARFIWPFYRYRKWPPVEKPDFLTDYDIEYGMTPVRRVPDLNRLMLLAERDLKRLACPLLVVQSHTDETVRPVSADIIYTGVSSREKELMMLERSPHVLTLGPEREAVYQRILMFIGAENDPPTLTPRHSTL